MVITPTATIVIMRSHIVLTDLIVQVRSYLYVYVSVFNSTLNYNAIYIISPWNPL